jgi:polyhydroxybutyrate depolymerase
MSNGAWSGCIALASILALAGSVPGAAQRGPLPLRTGDSEITLTHEGRRRTYLVHVPSRAVDGARPVLLAFHGGGGNASGFKAYAGLAAIADREGVVVVYPNGTGLLPNALLTFNAGKDCCGYALNRAVDDVGFAAAIVDDLARRVSIDRQRIYATGHSNGGIMAYRLAAERADLIAAIAPVAGAMSLTRFAPSHPVAVLHIHSVDDPRALYGGGLGPPFPGTDNRVLHAAVGDVLAMWARHNGCQTTPTAGEPRAGRRGSPDAAHTVTRLSYAPCSSGRDVAHLKLTGAGHGWPGAPRTGRERLSGPQTTIVNAAEEIWAFVSKYRR